MTESVSNLKKEMEYGKHDMLFPVETAQKPMFGFLGTPDKDKRILICGAGHLVPRAELIKESLAWFDKYLGPR